jgi:hypothetical protein
MDVISDDTEGVAIYRFQLLAWTIGLVFVFIFNVAVDRSISTFDVATLGLLGIRSGTHLNERSAPLSASQARQRSTGVAASLPFHLSPHLPLSA